jgi:hypothetical protein
VFISPILKDRRFLQCHTSFVVNMRRVERFAKDRFTLRGGKIVPIAAKQYPAVRDTYMNYLMAKGGQTGYSGRCECRRSGAFHGGFKPDEKCNNILVFPPEGA